MEVFKLINAEGIGALAPLKIQVTPVEDLISLMYSQFDSPKEHPVVRECRGLVITGSDETGYRLVARGYDRFFNYGEADTRPLKDVVFDWYDKLDGSLVRVYRHNGKYHLGSKSSAFAFETGSFRGNASRIRFDVLVHRILGLDEEGFQELFRAANPNEDNVTFLFELTSPLALVVTPYKESRLRLLSVRHNDSGEYLDTQQYDEHFDVLKPVFRGTPDEAIARAAELRDFHEGFVGYDETRTPVLKVKSPSYVAAHMFCTNFSVEKNALRTLLKGEESEFLTYFPHLDELFTRIGTEVQKAYDDMDKVAEDIRAKYPNFDPADKAMRTEVFALLEDNHFQKFINQALVKGGIPSERFRFQPSWDMFFRGMYLYLVKLGKIEFIKS